MKNLIQRLMADPYSHAADLDLDEHLTLVFRDVLRSQEHHPEMSSRTVRPDPKPRKRIVNRHAGRAKLALELVCRCGCGARATDRMHLVGKDLGGDDVEENLVPGAHACHMMIETRAPGWEAKAGAVRASLSRWETAYVVGRKGVDYLDSYWPAVPA